MQLAAWQLREASRNELGQAYRWAQASVACFVRSGFGMGVSRAIFLSTCLFGVVFLNSADDRPNMVTVASGAGFAATVQELETRLDRRGFTIMAKLDQAPPDSSSKSLLFVFGLPDRVDEEGWLVMDSPYAIVVWETEEGETKLSFEPGQPSDAAGDTESVSRSASTDLSALVENIGRSPQPTVRTPGPPASPSGLSVVNADALGE
ncbi:hypothetical protein [Pelagicoccus sp. SDUM812003]|uniref:hypothetical protein n=1 Tax=Pelagicoccus sp. SDUM812003 TaxID=3041267 RepID=UPI00280EB90F|nr:hypothetical protein [Pelagicoccus sp. SDUM812003]MDQ8205051.1 hypothetical protein [Pelagicoccus sp. SDUM812003]